MQIEWIITFIMLTIMLVLFLIILLKPKEKNDWESLFYENQRQQQNMIHDLQSKVEERLGYYQGVMNENMKNDLNTLNETTTKNLFSIQKNVHENLTHGYESTSKVIGKVLQQMGKLDESQNQLKDLSSSITHLQSVLTDKKTRGIYGEIELYSILESVMGANEQRYSKQFKLSNGTIVDAILFANEPLYNICVDSKFPLENFNRLQDENSSDEIRVASKKAFIQDVKKHIKTINDKYIIPHETAFFSFMFVPAEAIFAYLYAECEDVIQYSYQQHVYIVSPTTLMAYISAIKAIYIGQQRNDNMVEIQKELRNLQVEFERFEKRYDIVNNDFERCYNDMKSLGTTTVKIIKRFKEIEEVELEEKVE